MAATPKVNYTTAMVETMLSMYTDLGNDGIEEIARTLGRPIRSVRSKLVREGVYVAPAEKPKAVKDEGPTKKELVNELEKLVDFEVEGLMGATKSAIASVIVLARQVQELTASDEDEPADETETESV
jgi:hypothetical protein